MGRGESLGLGRSAMAENTAAGERGRKTHLGTGPPGDPIPCRCHWQTVTTISGLVRVPIAIRKTRLTQCIAAAGHSGCH